VGDHRRRHRVDAGHSESRRPRLTRPPRARLLGPPLAHAALELVGNTLALLAGVGAGALVVGTGLAWLVVTYRFPGRGILEWALVLPLAVPAYVIGFAFLGLFGFTGPVQIALRRWLGTGVRLRSSGRTGASSC
jgi:ABC-type Fe3+ transport system permease subunit